MDTTPWSGSTLQDALVEIVARLTVANGSEGAFAFLKVNNTGNYPMFILMVHRVVDLMMWWCRGWV